MKDKYYFQHDYNARNDQKITRLLMKGWDYYGIYWALVEKLHEEGGYLNLDYEALSFDLRTNKERIKEIVESFDLFIIDKNAFTSKRVIDNLKERSEKSEKARKSIYARWKQIDTNVIRTKYDSNTRKKGKERKEKETKTNTQTDVWFNEIWNKYPKGIGKKQALRHFLSSVKTEADFGSIQTALGNYLVSAAVARGFVQNGSTWFNNWRDWIDAPPDLTPKIYGYTKDKKPVTDLEIAKVMGMV